MIDLALGGLPYEEGVVDRASDFQFIPGITLRTCSAEDLIILKAFADRTRDWADIEGILLRRGSELDWKFIYTQLQPLCELKESPEILQRLRGLQSELQSTELFYTHERSSLFFCEFYHIVRIKNVVITTEFDGTLVVS